MIEVDKDRLAEQLRRRGVALSVDEFIVTVLQALDEFPPTSPGPRARRIVADLMVVSRRPHWIRGDGGYVLPG